MRAHPPDPEGVAENAKLRGGLHGANAPAEASVDSEGRAVEVPGGGLDQVGQDDGDVCAEECQLLGQGLAHAAVEPEAEDAEVSLPPGAM